MEQTEFTFPAYRKYSGINVWFKILDAHHFIEIKQVGSKYRVHHLEATQYPEMVFIKDMLACYEARWEEIAASQFEHILSLTELS